MSADMPEPGDLTVLYWPETEVATAAVAVRDDTAYGVKYGAEGDAHWWTFGLGKVGPLTWGELWALCHQVDAPIAEATVLTAPAELDEDVEQLRQQLGEATDHLMAQGWADVAAGMEAEARAAQPAEPTDAEIVAAAKAMVAHVNAEVVEAAPWDELDDEERDAAMTVARLALTAAAQVRAGVDDEDES